MDEKLKKEYIDFIKKQLAEMAEKVNKVFLKNQEKRENNVFLIFSDENAKKYMGVGRSIDSQLGTRLQKIAMFVARKKYGIKSVPNIITLYGSGDAINVSMISYPFSNGMSQKVYWTDKSAEMLLNKTAKSLFDKGSNTIIKSTVSVKADSITIDKIRDECKSRDEKTNGIPIDLFIFENNADGKIIAHSYELKAGGNLDTKNAISNANEVKSLQTIFSFCDASLSKFATCYDGKGDGMPDGSIKNHLDETQILIGEKFWNEILEESISYDDFIEIYKEAYKLAKVEETLIGEKKEISEEKVIG